PGAPERLVQAQTIYGRILEYERWLFSAPTAVSADKRQAIEDAFSRANHTLREGDLEASRLALATAIRLIDDLRHPLPGTIEASASSPAVRRPTPNFAVCGL